MFNQKVDQMDKLHIEIYNRAIHDVIEELNKGVEITTNKEVAENKELYEAIINTAKSTITTLKNRILELEYQSE